MIKQVALTLGVSLAALLPAAHASEEVTEALEDYFMMAGPTGGSLGPEQIPAEEWANFAVIDTRSAARFAAGAIPNAIHIEWREVLARQDELPTDQPLLLYYDTGVIYAPDTVALNSAGFYTINKLPVGYAASFSQQTKPKLAATTWDGTAHLIRPTRHY